MKIRIRVRRSQKGNVYMAVYGNGRCSICVFSGGDFPAPYGRRTTAGQRKIIENFSHHVRESFTYVGEVDLSIPDECASRFTFGSWTVFWRDAGNIGGLSVRDDGPYLANVNGQCYKI